MLHFQLIHHVSLDRLCSNFFLLAGFVVFGHPLRTHRYILEQRIDGCPCRVQWGGYAKRSSKISAEIITVREYTSWVKAGRPRRQHTSFKHTNGFCRASSSDAHGDHVLLVGADNDGDVATSGTLSARNANLNPSSISTRSATTTNARRKTMRKRTMAKL